MLERFLNAAVVISICLVLILLVFIAFWGMITRDASWLGFALAGSVMMAIASTTLFSLSRTSEE